MGAQFIKHIIWDDLATSGWKHLFPMQSNLKKFEEIWRFILLIRSLSRRCARRQNLNVVVWVFVKTKQKTRRPVKDNEFRHGKVMKVNEKIRGNKPMSSSSFFLQEIKTKPL